MIIIIIIMIIIITIIMMTIRVLLAPCVESDIIIMIKNNT